MVWCHECTSTTRSTPTEYGPARSVGFVGWARLKTIKQQDVRPPAVIVVAGVDASRDREINYGIWLSPWKSLFVRYAFRRARKLLVVAPFLGEEARRLAAYDGANIQFIPFGFDPAAWNAATICLNSRVGPPGDSNDAHGGVDRSASGMGRAHSSRTRVAEKV